MPFGSQRLGTRAWSYPARAAPSHDLSPGGLVQECFAYFQVGLEATLRGRFTLTGVRERNAAEENELEYFDVDVGGRAEAKYEDVQFNVPSIAVNCPTYAQLNLSAQRL